jgi:hypothetical protein
VLLYEFSAAQEIFSEAAQAAADVAASAAADTKAVRDYLTRWSFEFALSSDPAKKQASAVLLEWLQLLDKQTELIAAPAALAPGLAGALSAAAAALKPVRDQLMGWGGSNGLLDLGTLAYQR